MTYYTIDYTDYPTEGEFVDEYLEEMQLNGRPKTIDYLPTGLLVAGFLANVYMLEIDKAIDKKLDDNHEVIHFRYVDDHVIISTSPEMLCNWVNEYEEMLRHYGLNVNRDKLEPIKELHEKSWNDDVTIDKVRADASITPKYPTPLSTQTLNKVSQLSNVNLNLLSDKEFDLIFNDLLSLLVTEIPEQEIKKSTRISFASTLLSRLLVNGDIDYDEVYRLRLKWVTYVNKLEDYLQSDGPDKKTLEEINHLKDVLIEFVFNDGDKIDINEQKRKYPNIDFTILSNIRNLWDTFEKTRIGRNRQVFELLCHALRQVPDKVRVWVRCMTFCSKHYPKGCNQIYSLLDELKKEGEIHELSAEYLYSILNMVVAELAVKAFARNFEGKYKEIYERDADMLFLHELNDLPAFSTSTHSFVKDSLILLEKVLVLINSRKLGETNFNHDALTHFFADVPYHGINLDKTFWIRWWQNIIADKSPKENKNNEKLNKFLNKNLDTSSPFYPHTIIQQEKDIDIQVKKGWITLAHWIDYINNKDNNISQLDVRNSEMVSVLILISLCNYIDKQEITEEQLLTISPNNILLDRKTVDNEDWNYYLSGGENIKVELSGKDNLKDKYFQTFVMDEDSNIHNSSTYALGIIFLQTLTKKSRIPWILDREEYGFEWQGALNDLMERGCVSSLNYRIISSCLSLNSRETRMLRYNLGDEDFVDDTFRQTPVIKSRKDLLEQLNLSLDSLKQNLISVANEQHRQLLVIDLD